MANDLWLTCTLKFPGTYPPGGEGPGGGGEGGGGDDPPGGEPCEDSAIYWTCVSGEGGDTGPNKPGGPGGGRSSGGWSYCVQAEFNVEDIDNDDCQPPPSFDDTDGVTWYSDAATCEALCDVGGGAGGGGGGLGGGSGGGGPPGQPCVAKSYVCDPTSNTCSVFWMNQNHTCFATLFDKNNNCTPLAAGPGVCSDGTTTYYAWSSDCTAACGGGTTCNYSCSVDTNSINHGSTCVFINDNKTFNVYNDSTPVGTCAGVAYVITSTSPNQFTVFPKTFSLAPGGTQAINVIFRAKNPGTYNSTITITGQGCSQVVKSYAFLKLPLAAASLVFVHATPRGKNPLG